MNPLYFGASDRRLFGLYTPPRAARTRPRAVVVCHPWGPEYVQAHRSLRHLTRMLAVAGCDVLGFDYFGTGDSAGDMTDADVAGWLSDIEMAIEELKDTADAPTVAVVGLRLGATLAANVAANNRKAVDALVLWDPVVSGREYVEELTTKSSRVVARAQDSGGGFDIAGFPLSEAMLKDLQSIDLLGALTDRPARTLVVFSGTAGAHPSVTNALAAGAAGPFVVEEIPSEPVWTDTEMFGTRPLPVTLLHRVTQWLS